MSPFCLSSLSINVFSSAGLFWTSHWEYFPSLYMELSTDSFSFSLFLYCRIQAVKAETWFVLFIDCSVPRFTKQCLAILSRGVFKRSMTMRRMSYELWEERISRKQDKITEEDLRDYNLFLWCPDCTGQFKVRSPVGSYVYRCRADKRWRE